MSETWIRRSFDAAGLTQYPTGKGLAAIQAGLSGSVILCLDVSSSMSGSLAQARKGAQAFIADARRAGYRVGLIGWNTDVQSETPLGADLAALDTHLDRLHASGGTDVRPALRRCWKALRGLSGDRVVAVFGDGDLGPAEPARLLAGELAADGIRIITMGLGDAAARTLDTISTEKTDTPRTASAATLEADITGLTSGLKKKGSS